VTELHRVERRYAHDGKLTDLLGGLHTAIRRLDALLARYASSDLDAAAGSLAPGSGEWTDAVLGAIAIRDQLAHALIAGAAATDDDIATGTARDAASLRTAPEPESLLR
jgi:hypothetical protein